MKKNIILVSCVVLLNFLYVQAEDYAYYTQGVQRGLMKNACLSYATPNSVDIKTGYGECNGHYWEIKTVQTITISDPNQTGFIYICIDDSNATYPRLASSSCFVQFDQSAAPVEPSWSDSKQGWYCGDDRCIGVVYWDDTSNTLKQFEIFNETQYFLNVAHIVISGSPSGTWQTCSTASYIPVNASKVYLMAAEFDNDSYAYIGISPDIANTYNILEGYGYGGTNVTGEIGVSSNRNIKWYGEDNDDNATSIYIRGYQILR